MAGDPVRLHVLLVYDDDGIQITRHYSGPGDALFMTTVNEALDAIDKRSIEPHVLGRTDVDEIELALSKAGFPRVLNESVVDIDAYYQFRDGWNKEKP